ncbi:40444_t:CDS:1, partial [Gigaspora margarita]
MNNKNPKERQQRLQRERQQSCRSQKKRKTVKSIEIPKARVYLWTSYGLQRYTLGSMDPRCSKCGALMWLDERITNKSIRSPIFSTCCANGKVSLPPLQELPPPFDFLLTGTDPRS